MGAPKREPRRVKAKKALRLYSTGADYEAIGQRLGISAIYAYHLVRDPEGEKDRRALRRAYPVGEDAVECRVCGERLHSLAPHLRWKHDLTVEDYRERFPGAPTVSDSFREIRRDIFSDRYGPAYWTRERIVQAIRAWADRSGTPPTQLQWRRGHGGSRDGKKKGRWVSGYKPGYHPSSAHVCHVFGSWSAAIGAAGYKPRDRGRQPGFRFDRCRKGHPFTHDNVYSKPVEAGQPSVLNVPPRNESAQRAQVLPRSQGCDASVIDRSRSVNFDETVAFLAEQRGRWVEVRIQVPAATPRPRSEYIALASLAGQVKKLTDSPPGDGRSIWLQHGDTDYDLAIRIDPDLFESAEVEADVVPADERPDHGVSWTLTIRQAGTITDVLIYV